MADPVALAVVVCTYNRAELLAQCLGALTAQLHAALPVELIVVDNASTDDTPAVARAALARFPQARVVREAAQGLSHARNRGFREARAPWIAYVDDDALARPGYLVHALDTIARCEFDAFGGVFLPWYRYGKPRWYRDEYASNAGTRRDLGLLDERQFMSGGNCLFRRATLERFGGFRTDIGMRGGKRSFGEETEMQVRMRKQGLRIGFDPELIVEHLVPLAKMDLGWMLRDGYAAGRDSWHTFEQTPSLWRKLGSAAIGLLHAQTRIPLALVKLARPGYFYQNAIFDIAFVPAFCLGRIAFRPEPGAAPTAPARPGRAG